MSCDARPEACVLVGPTGSGKTPLGQLLETRGLGGRACAHFDFGENLRSVVTCDQLDEIVSREDIDFLRGVLASGALLEDKDFPLAGRILRSFLNRCDSGKDSLIILNGLPRHVGQASAVAGWLRVTHVIQLVCSLDVVMQRLANDTGGDRGERMDDGVALVQQKLTTYQQRTLPLIDYLCQQGSSLNKLQVTGDMAPEEMWKQLNDAFN